MKFWQVAAFSETDQLIEIAKAAEESGFHGLMLSDHLVFPDKLASPYPYSEDGKPPFDGSTPYPDPWTVISAMAAVTTRLQFSTMIYIVPLREPLQLAKTLGTVSLLSGGRVALGGGAGWIAEEFNAAGIDFRSRGKRYDEMIEAMRKLWSGEMVEYHGDHFDFERVQMSPAPSAPVPIYIGGGSGPALRRAARIGDGWIGTGNTPEDASALLVRMAKLREEAGRADQPFENIVPLAVPPDLDLLPRLEDEGMTATTAWPFVYSLGPTSTIEAKRDVMRRFGDEVIAKLS